MTDNLKYLHCQEIYTDSRAHFCDTQRLPDGRLFTVGYFGKCNRDGHFSKVPTTQYVYGRVSSDEGKTWTISFFRELPETVTLTAVGDFLIDRNGRIHIFFLHIYNISFESSALTKGNITYMRIDNPEGENAIYKKIDALDRYTGSMNNVLELKSGRIIAPFSTIAGMENSMFTSSVIYSDDSGDTWRASNDVAVCSDETHLESGAVEPVVVEAREGVLVMLIRTVLNALWYSVSYDDGATWSAAKPTQIPSSNAPSAPIRLPDGRIVLVWNDVLGQPMNGVRYSFARQCLYAAVSDDGLRTLKGVRMIVRKRADDPDSVLNCYPFCTLASEKEIFVSPFAVQTREDIHWGDTQATLLRMNPDDLLENEIQNSFDEWVTDCEKNDDGISMRPTVGGVAYACVNFPYSVEGEMTLRTKGKLPKGAKLLFSDCYLDRLNFLPEKQKDSYTDIIGKPFVELEPTAAGEWKIRWDEKGIALTSGEKTQTVSLNSWNRGFNHAAVLFEGDDSSMDIVGFFMRSIKSGMSTGIEY